MEISKQNEEKYMNKNIIKKHQTLKIYSKTKLMKKTKITSEKYAFS